jgi:hypothetical protein
MKQFVLHYLRNPNATEAARLAGYKDPNVLGPRLLHHPLIRKALDKQLDRLGLSAAETLANMAEIARGVSIADFIPEGGGEPTYATVKASPKAHLIKKLTPTKQGLSLDMHDRVKALDAFGRYHKLWAGSAGEVPFRIPDDLSGYDDAQIALMKQGKDPGPPALRQVAKAPNGTGANGHPEGNGAG